VDIVGDIDVVDILSYGNLSMSTTLQRELFSTSRLLEFFSEKELHMQIGFAKSEWPIALLKELVDNSLDGCETAGVLPDLTVTLQPHAVSVQDNGPGLPASTIERSLDYLMRVSDKAHYVSPTRGQLGNALKCVWAAPYVAHGEAGSVEVTTHGMTHRISVTLDRIAQQPTLQHRTMPDGVVKNGTLVKLIWPGIASCLDLRSDQDSYKSGVELLLDYAAFNPHMSLTYHGPEDAFAIPRTTPHWRKWLPCDPTSPHWYTLERLQSLIAAYLAEEQRGRRAMTVRELVAQFRGLSGSAKGKRVLEAAGLSRAYLHDLIVRGDIALEPVRQLLEAMQRESRPVNPAALGVLGEAHVRTCLTHHRHVVPESIKYRKVAGEADGLPAVLEVACGWYTPEFAGGGRQTIVGVNWTPALRSPFRELSSWLGECRVDAFDPVVIFVHLAMPRIRYNAF
jgi:DNA topoisomerase-6 subunit B